MNNKDMQVLGFCIVVIAGIALFSPACKGICKASALRLIGVGLKAL